MQIAEQIDIQSLNGIAALALLVIVAFAIDRIVTGIMFARFVVPPLARRYPDPATVDGPDRRRRLAKELKLIYYVLSIIIAAAVVAGPEVFGAGGRFGAQKGIRIVQPLLAQSLTELVPKTTPAATVSAGEEAPASDGKGDGDDDGDGDGTPSGAATTDAIEKVVAARVAPWLDILITIIVLVGGADRIAAFAKLPGSIRDEDDDKPARPVALTGRLSLDRGDHAGDAEEGDGKEKKA